MFQVVWMKSFLDVVSQEILPGARALIAKRLIESGLSQKQAAAKMGVSQPAISQYKRDLRGKADFFKKNPKLMELVNRLADKIASGEVTMQSATMELFEACKGYISED